MQTVLYIVLCIIIGYALGNFSPSYILGRRKGYDIREEGSGNAGATNAFLLLGRNAFFLTAILDILKSFAAYKICQLLFPTLSVAGPIAGSACIIGHIWPVLMRFKGGKGMASLGGVILAWDWKWFLILLATAIIIAFGTRYVCLVAPIISVVFPVIHYVFTLALVASLILLIPSVPIFAKHWENFKRIKEGTEMRTSFIWNKEGELKRIGKWNEKTESQLERRNK